MNGQSGSQWPEPYARRHLSPEFHGPAWYLLPYRTIFSLSVPFKFGICLSLIGPPALALLLFCFLPAVYQAQTNVVIGAQSEHQAGNTDTREGLSQRLSQESVNAEADLLANPAVVERVLAHIGINELYPDVVASRGSSRMAWDAAVQRFQSSLRVIPIPQSNAIRLTFEHINASTAVKALNQFVLAYQASRAKVLEGRNSRADSATVMRDKEDLEQLEHTRDKMRAMLGAPDIALQREKLTRQRADADLHIRQTLERIQALSIRLANLTQLRSRVVADRRVDQIDNHSGAPAARNAPGKQNLARAAGGQSRTQLVAVPDQTTGAAIRISQIPSGQTPLQLAPLLLNQAMTRNQGLSVKATAGSGLAAYETQIARDLRNLDKLEQNASEPKPNPATAPDQSQAAQRPEEQALQSGNEAAGHSIVLAHLSTNPPPVALSTLKATAVEMWADLPLRQFGPSSGYDQTDPLVERLQQHPPAIQELVEARSSIPAKSPMAPLPAETEIDGDRVAVQLELNGFKVQQSHDTVTIALIDQQLVRLEQAEIRLNLQNARIADQHERVAIAQRNYDHAKAAESRSRGGIGDFVQVSSDTISVSSMRPEKSVLAIGSAIASLLLFITMLVIAIISSRRSIARAASLELFLNVPRSEAG